MPLSRSPDAKSLPCPANVPSRAAGPVLWNLKVRNDNFTFGDGVAYLKSLNRAFHQVVHFAGARRFGEAQCYDFAQMQFRSSLFRLIRPVLHRFPSVKNVLVALDTALTRDASCRPYSIADGFDTFFIRTRKPDKSPTPCAYLLYDIAADLLGLSATARHARVLLGSSPSRCCATHNNPH
jgi:hypothetical protein